MPGKRGGNTSNARTPEELETLFEDALMIGDGVMLADIFDEGAVLVIGDERRVHGSAEIMRIALATWQDDHPYVADPRCVMQARDIALIVTEVGINVMRRNRDGTWRYAIVFQSASDTSYGRSKR